jgi:hypothetical protein
MQIGDILYRIESILVIGNTELLLLMQGFLGEGRNKSMGNILF